MIIPWNTIRRTLMRLPSLGAEHAFFSMLFLIAAAGVLSLLLFYVYGFSSQTKEVQQEASLYDFKEELFRDTLEVLEKRELNLEDARRETSKDIFNPAVD